MNPKIRQLTDTIHGTVYLSQLESELMSTPFFYRLNDVYQSSTVFVTFPCNRTKRYEHSCGTMSLAAEMFYSAITNANNLRSESFGGGRNPAIDLFFNTASEQFEAVLNSLSNTRFLSDHANEALGIIESHSFYDLLDTYGIDVISDSALEHYRPSLKKIKEDFLYQVILEAIRIDALFHDVGHPPYSHILEKVITDIYEENKDKVIERDSQKDPKDVNPLPRNISAFIGKYFKEGYVIGCIGQKAPKQFEFHERVGIQILVLALIDGISELEKTFKRFESSGTDDDEYIDEYKIKAIYCVAVAEFALAIWCETNSFFRSLHKIIDGYLDVDRLDYVVRDSMNSGTNWGIIPYKRILESARLSVLDYSSPDGTPTFVISYPQKIVDDIDDVFILRYKIFARVNFHHRCIKTSLLLQEIVRRLARDFVKNGELALCPQISDLWTRAQLSKGKRFLQLQNIKWNDSVITSYLYDVLIKLSERPNHLSKENQILYHMLREFLLNKKYFYSVYKRQYEITDLIKEVYKPFEGLLERIRDEEPKRLYEVKNDEDCNAKARRDSIMRLADLKAHLESCDIDTLERFFTASQSDMEQYYPGIFADAVMRKGEDGTVRLPNILVACVRNALEQFQKDKKINNFLIKDNSVVRTKTGLPEIAPKDRLEGVYLHTMDQEDVVFRHDCASVRNQLNALTSNCLLLCAYIEPANAEEVDDIIQEIREAVRERYTRYLKGAIKHTWPNLSEDERIDTDRVMEEYYGRTLE